MQTDLRVFISPGNPAATTNLALTPSILREMRINFGVSIFNQIPAHVIYSLCDVIATIEKIVRNTTQFLECVTLDCWRLRCVLRIG